MRTLIRLVGGFVLVAAGCSAAGGVTTLPVTVTELPNGQVSFTAPRTVRGPLVELRLRNKGQAAHDVQVLRVAGNHGAGEVADVIGADNAVMPDWMVPAGGVGAVTPGKTTGATMQLQAGNYYLVDTAMNDNDESYARLGGITPLTVVIGGSTGGLPPARATITAHEYAFGVPPLAAGTTRVRFENTGKQPHTLIAFPIVGGATWEQVTQAFLSEGQAQAAPPIDTQNYRQLAALDAGRSLVTDLTLQKGRYAFACFLSDRGGGPPHVVLGMLQEVVVG